MYYPKKMYFFSHEKISNIKLIFLFIRMIGRLLIGQKIKDISLDKDNEEAPQQLRLYFYKEIK